MSSFCHLITFDKRGVGMSDPLPAAYLPTLAEWADDVVAVLDAEQIERASIVGKGSGGLPRIIEDKPSADLDSRYVRVIKKAPPK